MKLMKFLGIVVVALSTTANAGMISDYLLDGDIVTDSANHLEWLQWDQTVGMSVNDALKAYQQDGWALASNDQVVELFNTFFRLDLPQYNSLFEFTNEENNKQRVLASHSSATQFMGLFGQTFTSNAGVRSGAIFGLDTDLDGLYNDSSVFTSPNIAGSFEAQLAEPANATTDQKFQSLGIALVRKVQVPEPGSIALFALGLLGLSARRLRKTS